MTFFRRKTDPIAERERDLSQQIAQLEDRIKSLSAEAAELPPDPPIRPPSAPPRRPAASAVVSAPPLARKPEAPAFIAVGQKPAGPRAEDEVSRDMYNDLGARKFDLVGAVKQLTVRLKSPPPTNPHLLKYLASGGLPGMRALRYEKRVARNRFLFLVVGFTLLLWAILAIFLNNR